MEEINIIRSISNPHLTYILETLIEKKKVARSVLNRKEDEILLIDSSGFLIDSVFAGISEKHIEYIAIHGPKDYKENIIRTLKDEKTMKETFEIVKAMDEDLGEKSTQNQERIKKVIQYVKDNRIVFKFD